MKKYIVKHKKLLIIGITFIIVLLIMLLLQDPKVYQYVFKNNNVNHDIVDELYNSLEVNDCTIVDLDSKDKNTEAILYIIFSKLNKENKLTDKVKITEYQETAKELLGTETNIYPNNYHFGTYIYNKENNVITRQQMKCESNTKYVSKLFGYSQGIETLTVHIKIGYIKNNKVYDLQNNELGEYSEKKLNTLLDKATTQKYIYRNDNNNYYLENVTQ